MKNGNLNGLLISARSRQTAVGAFNIFNELTARATVKAAESLGRPVILQTSVGTVRQYGIPDLIGLLRMIQSEARVPVLIHLDHCTDPDLAIRCAEAGWDSVMIDASHVSLEENIRLTRLVCSQAHALGVQVEGEIGVISGVEEEVAAAHGIGASLEDTLRYVADTGIDAVAPAIGTAHGIYQGTPVLNYGLLADLARHCACPVVIHGGTGLPGEAFQRLVELGAAKINVSTAIKQAYLEALRGFLTEHPEADSPLRLDQAVSAAVIATVRHHLMLFQAASTAAVSA